jgi:hypothetical protein
MALPSIPAGYRIAAVTVGRFQICSINRIYHYIRVRLYAGAAGQRVPT